MLTIFAVPKPFIGHVNIIQRNAICSWLELRPKCEIILLGNEEGVSEFAREHGIVHIPNVALSKYGTPLVPDIHDKAIKASHHSIVAYINADIILLENFMDAVQEVSKKIKGPFFIGGQRIDVELPHLIDFTDTSWEQKIKNVAAKGVLHGPAGMDYFVFPSNIPLNCPREFAAGRPGGDNWTVYRIKSLHIPFIDTTGVVTAVHSNHSHSYLQGEKNKWEGPESLENRRLAGGYKYVFTLEDADLLLTKNGFRKPALTIARIARYFETLPALHPGIGSWPKMVSLLLEPRRLVGKILRKFKIKK